MLKQSLYFWFSGGKNGSGSLGEQTVDQDRLLAKRMGLTGGTLPLHVVAQHYML